MVSYAGRSQKPAGEQGKAVTPKADVLVLIPSYNERETIERTLSEVLEHNPNVEILVLDDSSPDGTAEIVLAMAENDSRIQLLVRPNKEGLGKAYLAGFAWGLGKAHSHFVEMDADGSHRAADLTKLLRKRDEADLVIGSRWVDGGTVRNWPWYRKWISRGGNRYASWALQSSVRDLTAGFRIYSRELLEALPLNEVTAQGYGFQVELAWRAEQLGAKILEVPIEFVEREHGASKMTSDIVFEALRLVTKWGIAQRRSGRR